MYQALYRKWRPKTFDEVVGQEHVTQTLKRQVESGRLSHAYLFVGTRGTGKTTCAKILSRAVNCENPVNGNPCNKCRSCMGIESGAILDVEELDAASNNGVDNVRALREEAVYTPAAVKKRVYIVDEVHMLSTAAFNALLKILEEPPEHLIFILATTELHKVPATILSRCQRYSFGRIEPSRIAERLQYVAEAENIDLKPEGATALARLADGSMRDALSLLDQCATTGPITVRKVIDSIGLSGAEETEKLLSAACSNNAAEAVEILDRLYSGGKDMAGVLDELLQLVRDILITKLAPKGGEGLLSGGFDDKTLSDFGKKLSPARLVSMMDMLSSAVSDMGRAVNKRIAAEICMMRLCDESLSTDMASVVSRLDALEKAPRTAIAVPVKEQETQKSEVTFTEIKEEVPEEDLPPWDEDESTAQEKVPVEKQEKKDPETASAAPSSNGDSWNRIYDIAKPKLDFMASSYLGDSMYSVVTISDGKLTIHVKNAFAAQMIDTPAVLETVKNAAAEVLKKPVMVKVTDSAPETKPAEDKLDSLRRFSNITFE